MLLLLDRVHGVLRKQLLRDINFIKLLLIKVSNQVEIGLRIVKEEVKVLKYIFQIINSEEIFQDYNPRLQMQLKNHINYKILNSIHHRYQIQHKLLKMLNNNHKNNYK